MKYRIIDIYTGTPVTGKKKVEVRKLNTIALAKQINSQTYRSANGGRPEGWAAKQ